MNYLLIIRWQRTCEVSVTPLNDINDAWLLIHCLDRAMENGVEANYELQYLNENGDTEVINFAGELIGE